MKKAICSGMMALLLCAAPALASPASAQPAEGAAPGTPASFDMGRAARFGFGNILLGGWTAEDGWISAAQLQGGERWHPLRLWGGEPCRVYGLDGQKAGEAVMSALHSEHPGESASPQDTVPRFDVHTPSGVISEPSGLLAVLCPWEVQPRTATAMKAGNATYQGIVKKFLAAQGIEAEKPSLVQLFKVDLEGDGVDEVLIAAQNIAGRAEASFEPDQPLITGTGLPSAAQPGAYSVVLLRKIVGGKVVELPLHLYVSARGSSPADDGWMPPVVGKVCQFADLNGDGVMEIVAATAFYEGYAYRAFEVKGGQVREVLSSGAGS